MTIKQQKNKNAGFSLVELIIVIAIMAVLAGALAPSLIRYIEKSRRATDLRSADAIQAALQRVLAETEFPPSSYGQSIMIISETSSFNTPPTCVADELYLELDSKIPAIKSFPDYYWYIVYDDNYGSVPEVHLTDSTSVTDPPKYELFPDNATFAEGID